MERNADNTIERDWHALKPGDVIWFANDWFEVFDAYAVGRDIVKVKLIVDPNGGAAMGDYIATPPLFGPNVTDPDWDELVLDALTVPSGARGLEIRLRTQDGHRSNNSGFDSVAGTITIIPEPCTLLLLAGGLALMSGRRNARPR